LLLIFSKFSSDLQTQPKIGINNMNVQNDNFQENVETIQSELVTGEHEEKKEKIGVEEFSIKGDALSAKIKELVHQGNIRRIILKNEEGHILIEIPLTVGVVGGAISAAFFPILAAVGSIGAMVAHLTIVVEKRE
jgi:Domain of unknown function (DUF4342)